MEINRYLSNFDFTTVIGKSSDTDLYGGALTEISDGIEPAPGRTVTYTNIKNFAGNDVITRYGDINGKLKTATDVYIDTANNKLALPGDSAWSSYFFNFLGALNLKDADTNEKVSATTKKIKIVSALVHDGAISEKEGIAYGDYIASFIPNRIQFISDETGISYEWIDCVIPLSGFGTTNTSYITKKANITTEEWNTPGQSIVACLFIRSDYAQYFEDPVPTVNVPDGYNNFLDYCTQNGLLGAWCTRDAESGAFNIIADNTIIELEGTLIDPVDPENFKAVNNVNFYDLQGNKIGTTEDKIKLNTDKLLAGEPSDTDQYNYTYISASSDDMAKIWGAFERLPDIISDGTEFILSGLSLLYDDPQSGLELGYNYINSSSNGANHGSASFFADRAGAHLASFFDDDNNNVYLASNIDVSSVPPHNLSEYNTTPAWAQTSSYIDIRTDNYINLQADYIFSGYSSKATGKYHKHLFGTSGNIQFVNRKMRFPILGYEYADGNGDHYFTVDEFDEYIRSKFILSDFEAPRYIITDKPCSLARSFIKAGYNFFASSNFASIYGAYFYDSNLHQATDAVGYNNNDVSFILANDGQRIDFTKLDNYQIVLRVS